jgi:nucleotide-binding universal stress UspA family protein
MSQPQRRRLHATTTRLAGAMEDRGCAWEEHALGKEKAMLKIERILCPVDFSEGSEKAYDYAYSLALHYQATLYVEHVVPIVDFAYPYCPLPGAPGGGIYGDLIKDAEKRLHEMLSRHPVSGIWVERAVDEGFVPDAILSFAKNQNADLIVMGTHGRRGLNRLMMGSATETVLRKASCPVLAVRKPTHDFVDPDRTNEPVHLQRLLVCTDFSNCANAATEYALSLAQEYSAELTLLHVIEDFPMETIKRRAHEAREELADRIPQGARNWCKIKTAVHIGKAYQKIIQVATEQQVDLTVVGVQGRGAVDLAIFGSTADCVLQLGPCPVLAVHVSAGRMSSERPQLHEAVGAPTAA